MIHKILIACFIISICFFSCSKNDNTNPNTTVAQIDFVKTIGGSKNEVANAVVKTTSGGYAILGYTQSVDGDIPDKDNENFDYWLTKYNSENILEWSKTYGGSQDDRGNTLISTQDGGFAILGYSFSNNEDVTENSGLQDYWLAKLDASGNILWQKSFGYSGIDVGHTLLQTSDGGFFITGVLDVTASGGLGNTSRNTNHAGGDYWALKLDTTGNIQWSKYYGGSFTDTPYDAIETNDNGYIIVGSSDSDDVDIENNKGSYDFWIIKISATGTLLWEKSFGGSEIDEAQSIEKTEDGNYIIVGDTRSNDLNVTINNGAADVWVIKISPSGDLISQKTFGGSSFDSSRAIHKSLDGGYIIAGSSRSVDGDITNNNGQNDALVLKIDENLNLIWQKTIGGSEIDYTYDVTELDNQDIIVVGESNSSNGDVIENKGFTDLLIIKLK